MSYALLANLPPVYGLYTSLVPPLMYLMFGTCNQLSLGVSRRDCLLLSIQSSPIEPNRVRLLLLYVWPDYRGVCVVRWVRAR